MESPIALSGASAGASIWICSPSPSPSIGGDRAELLDDAGEHTGTVFETLRAAGAAGPRRACPARPARAARLDQLRCVGERAHAERAEQRAAVAADQPRRQEERERVDEARAQQRAGELRAALDEQGGDLALAEQPQRLLERRRPRAASTPAGGGGAPGGATRRTGACAALRASLLAGPRRPRRSKTTRSGRRSAGGSASRGSSSGSSASAVPLPTATASNSARQSCTSARLSGEEIQRLSPVLVAMRPSSVAASLSSTNGRPRTTCVRKAAFCRARPRLVAAARELHLDARGAQAVEAAPVDLGVRVADRRRRRARCRRPAARRRRAAGGRDGCRARARRTPSRPTTRLAAGVERVALGVRLAAPHVPALAQHAAVARDHAADERVRARAAPSALGQVERALEQLRVALVHASATRAVSACQASPGDGWP